MMRRVRKESMNVGKSDDQLQIKMLPERFEHPGLADRCTHPK